MKRKPDDDSEEALELARKFGETVRRLRTERNISQEAFAYECGLHRTSMSLIERGQHVVSLFTAWKVAKGLDISLGELIGALGEGDENSHLHRSEA